MGSFAPLIEELVDQTRSSELLSHEPLELLPGRHHDAGVSLYEMQGRALLPVLPRPEGGRKNQPAPISHTNA